MYVDSFRHSQYERDVRSAVTPREFLSAMREKKLETWQSFNEAGWRIEILQSPLEHHPSTTPYHNVYNGGGSPPKCINKVYITSMYIRVRAGSFLTVSPPKYTFPFDVPHT